MREKLATADRLVILRRDEHKLTLEQLADKTELSKSALAKYEDGDYEGDISRYAIVTLAKFYGVSTDYLLGLTENRNHPNTVLSELHLSDSALEVLKSGRVNPRLLSELICHPGFIRLMTDMEVCVDRIADMRLKDMNLLLEQARQKVIEKYHPLEDDLPLRTLELAQISEEMFYGRVLHKDLDTIVKDIRTAHEKDSTTAELQTEAEVTTQNMALLLAEALDYEGTSDERRAYLVCRTLDIKYDRLSDEDKKAFARVCKKSPKLANIISQRGKISPIPPKRKKK